VKPSAVAWWSGTTGSSDIVRILTKPTIRVTTTRPLLEQLKEAPHRVATELRELAKVRTP
jgi:hypothetical protein